MKLPDVLELKPGNDGNADGPLKDGAAGFGGGFVVGVVVGIAGIP